MGNKCDKDDRKVSKEEGAKLAKELNMQYFETSGKTNHNVDETFTYLIREILCPKKSNEESKIIKKDEAKIVIKETKATDIEKNNK